MTKKKSTKSTSRAKARSGPVPPYGDPIRQALAKGNLAEMRKVAASARAWVKNVESSLAKLEKQIEGLSARK
jgi:hypothetical protein